MAEKHHTDSAERTVQTPPAVIADMREKQIDVARSLDTLDAYNRGEFDSVEPVSVSEIPSIDGTNVIDFTGTSELTVARADALRRLGHLLPEALVRSVVDEAADEAAGTAAESVTFGRETLRRVGLLLYPRVAYGVLNGGSATSYADVTKNQSFSPELLDLLREPFDRLAQVSRGRAKGLTPAYMNPDGSLGYSFIQLKMRNLLLQAALSRAEYERMDTDPESLGLPDPLLPFFQMTSIYTDGELAEAYQAYRSTAPLAELIDTMDLDPTRAVGAVQPLLSAYTHSNRGRPKHVFASAGGVEGATLPIPGGHGQNFAVLADTYRALYDGGKRFVYLGNVDNLGCLPDPVAVAYLALTGKQAGFDFAFKSPVDVKGGILVRDQRGRLNCADIGPAITKDEVAQAEAGGTPILFNAATGLFDLSYLVPNLDAIAKNLPTRFSDQKKDAGEYSQAEQVTWEVLELLDDFLVFSVSKWDRLLAAKLLLETLMGSGLSLDDPRYPTDERPEADIRGAATKLHEGVRAKLSDAFGLQLVDGKRWEPRSST